MSLSILRCSIRNSPPSSSRADAIQLQQGEDFNNLAVDVQNLVSQISLGYTELEDLVRVEQDVTREVIAHEAAKTRGNIKKHVTAEIQTMQLHAGTEAQRDAFLQSLKFPEMNQRYNDLMHSRSATFKRVFSAYQDITTGDEANSIDEVTAEDLGIDESRRNHIDATWAEFINWLQSSDSLFCIRGKPGSGKSTLVKFVIDHENTKELLCRWSPDVTIISHFFWKIGSSTQNSIKGMLSSLVYQTLNDNQELTEYVLENFEHLAFKSNYHDWSTDDLEAVLHSTLEKDGRRFCVFIDGLDEIGNRDGLSNLIQSIERILHFPNVKVCVSSRPETSVMSWLKRKEISNLLLEDLTKPDMCAFVKKELEPYLSSDSISVEIHNKLVEELVWKAQGVFLWLHLATRSLKTGIQNDDSEDILLARLKGLPGELKQLYADMWQRLNEDNAVYRETAARYFRYALEDRGLIPMFPEVGFPSGFPEVQQPVLFQIACAEDLEAQKALLTGTMSEMRFPEVQRLCQRTELAIQTRCAGLLRVAGPRMGGRMMQAVGRANELDIPKGSKDVDHALFSRVIFIHRTAHDFFTDTETGQEILKCGVLSKAELQARLLKGLLCVLSFLHSEYGIMGRMSMLYKVVAISEAEDRRGLQEALKIFDIMQGLYDNKVIGMDRPTWQVQAPFLSLLTDYSQFDDFVIAKVKKAGSEQLATDVLREAWGADSSLYYHNRVPSARLIEKLLSMGADPHVHGLNRKQDMGRMEPFARQGTAFANLLTCCARSIDEGKYLDGPLVPELLKAAVAMLPSCPDLGATTLVIGRIKSNGESSLMNVTWLSRLKPFIQPDSPWILYEVDLKFLLLNMLTGLGTHVGEGFLNDLRVRELLPKLEDPSAKIRLIITCDEESEDLICHRIVSEVPAPEIAECLFAPCAEGEMQEMEALEQGKAAYERTMQLTKDGSAESVDLEPAILSLAEDKVGFCPMVDAGVVPTLSFVERLEEHLPYYPLTMERLKVVAIDVPTAK